MEKDLKTKKDELKKEWEQCFERKLDDVLNKESIDKFWDDDTSYIDAGAILTGAGIGVMIDVVISEIKNTLGSNKKFKILNIDDKFVYSKKFGSYEDAEEFIKEICYKSSYTRDDFDIFEEREDE